MIQWIVHKIFRATSAHGKILTFGWLSGKESACKAGDTGDASSIPLSGIFRARGNGDPQQYSSLETPMDRGTWLATVHRVAKSWTQHAYRCRFAVIITIITKDMQCIVYFSWLKSG